MTLRRTYELYLQTADGARTFEALTCRDETELVSTMRRILSERPLELIEAREMGHHVVTLSA
jgi:hypothetical protein